MAQLKHSEEEIIKLGEKLVRELDLEYSTNTLARWMSHYLAELMGNIDNIKSEEEKTILQQECCDIILKVWSQKENLPITKPLDNLKPIIEILEVLKEQKEVSILPRWLEYNSLPRNNEWASLVDLVKNNSEQIFSKVVQMNLHKDILSKDKEWLKENKSFLSRDEINFLELIDVMNNNDFSKGVIDLNDFEMSDDNSKRIKFMFDELENLIDEQKKELLKIKKNYLKNK
ncbi:hypothetical protein B0A69_03195 [Chryseobacterium shigense]|uniref:Uncharacterized protein n=1 Tax=Chryseobacterium shigense TaxID=297244 RepID=A0A1N7I7N2_9FLAO|nr:MULTISPECIES: hypothetical protein [Chryseobacterium]MDQ0593489.1 hypothetical protein [Chryseobacterium ginsenosidimutans]PQA97068.1 hypothetical protein B0A69_03195 [Chryseobacterium shigense]SIS33085.1 hypothetical protein SAMN05421639_102492 [Chryseobacterium shigense]VXB77334.1 conserved hypothetical protein [Chryseobacterium sp. 8AT]